MLAAEPGRYLVAESAVMVAGVLGREVRAGENWLYLDVGAYNGLIETHQTVEPWRFPLWSSRPDHAIAPPGAVHRHRPELRQLRHDVLRRGTCRRRSTSGDELYIGSAGAYTLSYASSFNGFPPPACLFVGH